MRNRISAHVILASVVLSCVPSVARAALTGGCAKVNITPPLGLRLIGSKGQPSDAVMDELYAKALVLSDGQTTVAAVSADLLYTPLEEITGPVRDIVEERIGIPPQNVMLCATHTHSGPEVFTRRKLGPDSEVPESEIDRSYLGTLVSTMAGAVEMAWRNMREVKIGASVGRLPEVLYNRRPKDEDGRVQMVFTLPAEVAATRRIETSGPGDVTLAFDWPSAETPLRFGPVDPDVFVLRVEDVEGQIVASLVGFGCHPVCIYPHLSTTISADYPGHATRLVEEAEGGVSLFALGLAGNTVPLQRGVKRCAQVGRALGGEAVRRLQFVRTSDEVTLGALRREITLPTKPAPATEQDDVEALPPEPVATEIQVLRLGDTFVLGLPGEVLVEVGLAIKKRAGVANLFVVTVANDAIGYVCHRQAYEEGGYESGRGTNLAAGAGEIVVEQALVLIEDVRRRGSQDEAEAGPFTDVLGEQQEMQ
jgi:hypothetical protein